MGGSPTVQSGAGSAVHSLMEGIRRLKPNLTSTIAFRLLAAYNPVPFTGLAGEARKGGGDGREDIGNGYGLAGDQTACEADGTVR